MQLYIDITVTCTCVSILAFFLRPHLGHNMFFFLYKDYKGSQQMRNIGVIFFLSTFAKINPPPMGFKHTKTNIYSYYVLHLLPNEVLHTVMWSHFSFTQRLCTFYTSVHLCVPVCLN